MSESKCPKLVQTYEEKQFVWYAWQDSNLRPFAPEKCGSKSLNSLSLFLPYNSGLSGILLSLEVDPHSAQLDRVLVQFRYSRTS